MAKNRIISAKTVRDIDGRVERVLRGIGHPDPPLRPEDVRELLQLDLAFYTADDSGVIHEAISRIRVAAFRCTSGQCCSSTRSGSPRSRHFTFRIGSEFCWMRNYPN